MATDQFISQTYPGSVPTPHGLGVPVQERLTLQREANDMVEQIQRAHGLLDHLTGGPSGVAPQNAALLSLSSAISTARGDIVRLCERIDSLLGAVGQI